MPPPSSSAVTRARHAASSRFRRRRISSCAAWKDSAGPWNTRSPPSQGPVRPWPCVLMQLASPDAMLALSGRSGALVRVPMRDTPARLGRQGGVCERVPVHECWLVVHVPCLAVFFFFRSDNTWG